MKSKVDSAVHSFTDEQLSAYGYEQLKLLGDLLRQPKPSQPAIHAVAEKVRAKLEYRNRVKDEFRFLLEFYNAVCARARQRPDGSDVPAPAPIPLIYEWSDLATSINVFADRIEYKRRLSDSLTIPLDQVATSHPHHQLPQVIVTMLDGQEHALKAGFKRRALQDAIEKAAPRLRATNAAKGPGPSGATKFFSGIVGLAVLVAIGFGVRGAFRFETKAEVHNIYKSVEKDTADQYEIAKRHGNQADRCAHAGLAAEAALQAKDEDNYTKLKAVETAECGR